MQIARVVVVNRSDRADRWAATRSELDRPDWPLPPPQRFTADEGDDPPPPAWWKSNRAAWGLLRSMVTVLDTARRDGIDNVLFLEDDVCFRWPLAPRLHEFLAAVPDDWDLIYLGGQHLGRGSPKPRRVNEHVLRGFHVHRNHAIVFRDRVLSTVVDHLTAPDFAHDRWHHTDHRLGKLQWTERVRVYTPHRWFSGQRASYSDILSAERPERYWDLPPRILAALAPATETATKNRG